MFAWTMSYIGPSGLCGDCFFYATNAYITLNPFMYAVSS